MTEIENLYSFIGGRFLTPSGEIQAKLYNIKAFVFDWDGVFNDGQKDAGGSSNFSEVDSMGTNLLRFSHFLKQGGLPITAIISGEKNETAFYFSQRECFNYSFFKVPHKKAALDFICEKENINPCEVAYFFDDVLALPIAELCGIRVLVNQKANPLFTQYCIKNKLVDYLTANCGGHFAIRESTELLCGLNDNFNEVIKDRVQNSVHYQTYIQARRQIKPEFFTLKDNAITSVNME